MKCKQAKKQLYLYAGNDLPQWKLNKIKNHLESCDACRDELEEIKRFMGIAVDSLKAGQGEPNQQDLWQKIQGEIEGVSKKENPERAAEKNNILKTIFLKQPFHFPYKTAFGFAATLGLIIMVFSVFNQSDPDKINIAANDQETVSDIDKYPVVEAVEKRNVTVMTMQTNDPKIKVVWFFDEDFNI